MSHSQARAALRVDEFCRLVGVSRTSFYKAVNAGAIRVIKIAGRTLVPANEVSRLLSGKYQPRKMAHSLTPATEADAFLLSSTK